MTRLILGAAIVILIAPLCNAQDRQFGGYDCTDDCSGHKAGYEWAESKSIADPTTCMNVLIRSPNSTSFAEGCQAYTEDPSRGSDEDDDGDDID